MKNAVVFDLDGTLVHTAPSLGMAINMLLERIGREPLDDDHLRAFVGNGARKLVARTLEYFGVGEDTLTLDEGVRLFFECYSETCLDVSVYPDLPRIVSDLKDSGAALCVLSNKPDKFVSPIVEHVFGEGTFVLAEGAREGIPHKPDPTSLQNMLLRVGSDADHCVFVGDSEVDVETARRAGCKCCIVDWGYRSRDVLLAAGAEYIFSNAQDLLEGIKTLF